MSKTALAKIAITSASDDALVVAINHVNQNFEGGRVTKTDLASWFIAKGATALSDTEVEDIRRAHFNQVVYLEALVKKLKSTGRENLGADELSALQGMLGQQTTKKRQKNIKPPLVDSAESNEPLA